MARLARDKHIDATLFRYFLRSNLWREFAEKFIRPEQIDTVDLDAIERLSYEQTV